MRRIFFLGIEIHSDRDHKFLGLSQKAYVDRVLERFGMKGCKPGLAPIFKGDRQIKINALKMMLRRQL